MTTINIKIERPPREQCQTYHDTAQMIASIAHPVGSREWIEQVEVYVKRYGHQEKLDTYRRLRWYFLEREDKKEFKPIKDFIESKIETHEDFSNRPDDMMIWGRGKWRQDHN